MGRYLSMDRARLVALLTAPRGWLALIVVVAGVVALVTSFIQPKQFRASADLWFGRTTDATSLVADEAGVPIPEPQAASLALATLDTTAKRVRRRFAGPVTVEDLKRAVDLRFKRNSDLVTVTAEWGEPAPAALIANTFAHEIVALRQETAQAEIQQTIDVLNTRIGHGETADTTRDEIRSLRARVGRLELLKALDTGDVKIVERATAPRTPSSPKPLRNAGLAGFAGLMVALIVLVLPARVDDRIGSEDGITALMPGRVMARIPDARVNLQDAAFVEAFEFLALQLQLVRAERGGIVVAFTSPADDDGKTTVVSRLADSLASAGAAVMAVNCDPRKPGPDSYLDIPPPEMVSPQRLRHVLEPLRDEADFVLVDTAPVSAVADASLAAAAADGVILVVDVRAIRRKELRAAKQQLANARANVLGLVLNRAPASSPSQGPRGPAEPAGRLGPPTFAA
jgi:Mrp family chromosome partitioning ATPase